MHNNEFRRKITKFSTVLDSFLPLLFWFLVIFSFADVTNGAITVLAALIHESGHLVILYILTGRGELPRGALNGLKLKSGVGISYKGEILLLASGAAFNIFASVISLFFFGGDGYAETFFVINLSTALGNLLPIVGYDGYGIIYTIMKLCDTSERGFAFLEGLSSLLTVSLCFVSLYLMYRFGTGYWIFGVFIICTLSIMRRGLKRHFFEF